MELHIHNYGKMWVDRVLFQMWLVMTDYYGSETEHQEAMDAAGARWDGLKELFEARNPEHVRRHIGWLGFTVQLRFQLV